MDRSGLQVAVKLLDKAMSTDSDPEAIALVEGCYRLLARAITAYDLEHGQTDFGPHRRERRLIADRRVARSSPPTPEEQGPLVAAGARYFDVAESAGQSSAPRVNLHL